MIGNRTRPLDVDFEREDIYLAVRHSSTGSAFGIGRLVGYAPGMFAYMVYGAIASRRAGLHLRLRPDEHPSRWSAT